MIALTTRADIAMLTIAHGKANAMDLEFCDALNARLEECRRPSIRAVIIAGEARIFSAGVDLKRVLEGGAEYLRVFLPALSQTFETLFAFDKPVVAAVNGHAIAGGCVLACAADWRVMARHAVRIGIPELLVGIAFPTVALEIMRFAVAPSRFQALVYGGVTVPPEDAVELGLADIVVEPELVVDRAVDMARELADLPTRAFALTKRQLRGPALARIRAAGPQIDPAVQEIWESPATLTAIRDYVGRTFGRK
jgi:enoyl-CoA hydratase